ncbi:RmlC-like cupin domain-containing protein [Halenospora varia]|nr:RmlC-like cupin domain-containing protein [Halenospora varia]
MSPKPTQPLVLPPTYTTTTPPESFTDPAYGTCTWHTLFSSSITPTDSLCAGIAVCPPNTGHLCKHRHTQAEIYHITDGKGIMFVDGKEYAVEKGSSVFVPGDAEHGIRNVGLEDLRWFYVFPGGSFGDVVYRFSGEEEGKDGGREGMVKSKL